MVLPIILTAARIAAPFILRQASSILGFIAKSPVKAVGLTLGVPTVIGLLTIPSIRKEISPITRFEAGKEFGEKK